MDRVFNPHGSDKVMLRGRCVACNCESSEDNEVYWFDYWGLALCKSCFIQLSTDQIVELKEDIMKNV